MGIADGSSHRGGHSFSTLQALLKYRNSMTVLYFLLFLIISCLASRVIDIQHSAKSSPVHESSG